MGLRAATVTLPVNAQPPLYKMQPPLPLPYCVGFNLGRYVLVYKNALVPSYSHRSIFMTRGHILLFPLRINVLKCARVRAPVLLSVCQSLCFPVCQQVCLFTSAPNGLTFIRRWQGPGHTRAQTLVCSFAFGYSVRVQPLTRNICADGIPTVT
jgi:hypothetical protein